MTETTNPFARFNRAYETKPGDMYFSHRMADTPNGLAHKSREEFAELLRQAADVVLTETDPQALADLYCFLYNARDLVPDVEAWCVVKHYHNHEPGGVWDPAVWTAHTTKEQAEEYAPAIYAHYRDRSPHLKPHQFLVEQKTASASSFIRPDVPVDLYIERLGR